MLNCSFHCVTKRHLWHHSLFFNCSIRFCYFTFITGLIEIKVSVGSIVVEDWKYVCSVGSSLVWRGFFVFRETGLPVYDFDRITFCAIDSVSNSNFDIYGAVTINVVVDVVCLCRQYEPPKIS